MQSDQHWHDRFDGLTIRGDDLAIASLIFIGFGSLYAFLSLRLGRTGVFSVNDVLFEIDAAVQASHIIPPFSKPTHSRRSA